MDDKTIQRKRWPGTGSLFYEGEGSFNMMSGDAEPHESGIERQEFVEFSSDGVCGMDCGSW